MKIVKVAATSLAAPLGATDTTFTLSAFVDSKGNAAALADFGVEAFVIVVIKQADTTEMIKCSAFVINADGSATFTVATNGRDILPKYPFTGSTEGQDFSTGADAIVTNDPLTMSYFATLGEDQTFGGKNTFTQVPSANADPVAGEDLTRLSYVQALVLGTLTTIDIIVPGTAGATIAAGKLIYFDTATGTWKLAVASTASTVNNVLLGIAQGAGVAAGAISGGILLQGVDTHQSGLTIGQVEYATNTPGAISNTPGTTIVAIGLAKSATAIYFNPRFDQQVTQDQMDALAGDTGTPSSSNKFITQQSPLLLPPGVINQYGGILAPTGWLMCDGSAVSRATYATLFPILNPSVGVVVITIASPGVCNLVAHGLKEGDTFYVTTTGTMPGGMTANTLYYVIATGLTANAFQFSATRGGAAINTTGSPTGVRTLWRSPYGLGDGSTTFNVPNFAGKVPVGRDSTDPVFALGEAAGEKTHVLTIAEMPAHNHPGTGVSAGGGVVPASSNIITGPNPSASAPAVSVPSQGSDGAHNNLQPYVTVNYIIKT